MLYPLLDIGLYTLGFDDYGRVSQDMRVEVDT